MLGKYGLGNAKSKGGSMVFSTPKLLLEPKNQKCNCTLPKQSSDFVLGGEGEGSG